MTLSYPHDHEEKHKGIVPYDQLPDSLQAPEDMSRLIAYMAADITGIGSGSLVPVEFDSTDDVVGTDIEVDGMDNTLINILTDGVYAISCSWFSFLDTPADGTAGYVQLSGAVAFVGPYIEAQPDAAYGTFAANPGVTRFIPAGGSFFLSGSMEGSDWTLGAFSGIAVQRIR